MSATARRLLLLIVILIGAWISRPDAQYQIAGSGGILSILLGGTGQTTAAGAFDALAPTSSNGDLIVRTSLTNTALYIGSVNTVLQSDGTNPSWQPLNFNTFTGQLPIANGGTGQATQTAAFNALSPLSGFGDLLYRNSVDNIRLGLGSAGQLLRYDGTTPGWANVAAGTDITGTLGLTNGGTGQTSQTAAYNALAPCAVHGNLVYYTSLSWACLDVGTIGQSLHTRGTAADPSWGVQPAFALLVGAGGAAGWSPLKSTTYYFGFPLTLNPGTVESQTGTLWVPTTATLRRVDVQLAILGTPGSNENVFIYVRQNTNNDLTVTMTSQWNAANVHNSAVMNTVFQAGDSLTIKVVTPAWVTAPTGMWFTSTIYFDVP